MDNKYKQKILDTLPREYGPLSGTYRDTNREPEHIFETIDSLTGAPARLGVSELQKGNFNFDTLKKVLSSIGQDPKNAPTGLDIAEQSGVTNPYLGAYLATAGDLAQLPVPTAILGKLSREADMGNDAIRELAKEYMKAKGISNKPLPKISKLNKDNSKKIADAYAEMKHDPNNPEVKAAYDALIKETLDQYQKIKDAGIKIEKIQPNMENPYKTSKDLMDDIANNKRVYYYPTESGFGSSGVVNQHPLLADTAELYDNKPMKANDILRIVHDVFGHGKEGYKFGSLGEENAWRAHKQMYSPEAIKALTSETRGQNSFVNYGPLGKSNRANPAQTVYADQKAGLLPDWATIETPPDKTGMAIPRVIPVNIPLDTEDEQY